MDKVNTYKNIKSYFLDYDEEFNIRDIACSYYELGNELVTYQKEINKNE